MMEDERMNKLFTMMILAVVAIFAGSGVYACGTSACNPPPPPPLPTSACGPTGCSETEGNMWLTVFGESTAWGNDALAASGARYNFTTVLGESGLDTIDFVNGNGGFMSVSEGSDWANAGGQSDFSAEWYKYFEW